MKKQLLTGVAIAILAMSFLCTMPARSETVGNQNPRAYFAYSPTAPMPGEIISFDASASYDPDGTITSYSWDFGDGTKSLSSNSITGHSYLIDGRYTVELTVRDNSGAVNSACAVVQVSTVVFFRVVFLGTLVAFPNVKVTVYYKHGGSWQQAPVGPSDVEIKYDSMTQPDLANTNEERYRNPGFTAGILLHNASNIGFDLHPSCWTVFFKFEWGGYTAYWPNETTRVYSYKDGAIESHDYLPCHRAYWDPSASSYVINVNDIHGHGVAPTQSHPIIVGILCPPPPVQYYLTVKTNPAGLTTIPGEGWYNTGTNVVLTAPSYANVTGNSRYKFNYWDIDGVSQGAGVNPITVSMLANHTATAHYSPQYLVVFDQNGLASDATGTVVTVNGSAKTFTMLPNSTWVDAGSSFTYYYSPTVNSTVPGKQYGLNSITGPASPITVTGPVNVTGNYAKLEPTKYTITFTQSGVGTDFSGTVVIVDGTGYPLSGLPASFIWDEGSTHTFSFISPLVVNPGKKYNWYSTTGLTALQTGNLTVTGSGNVTGNYSSEIKYQVFFDQTGINSAFTGNVVTVDGVNYGLTGLPVSFWWDANSNHTFVFASPLLLYPSSEQFLWVSTTGLSTLQSGNLTATASGNIVGNYKTQFYLALVSDPSGVASPSGQGWYDAGTNATISTPAFVDIVPGFSRYRFDGWETTNMSEIADPARSPTTVVVDENKTVTATYIAQYLVTFNQTGVGSDFTGTIVTIDGIDYNYSSLPAIFYWDNGTAHGFDFKSPLVVTPNGKRYTWISTVGLSTMQTELIMTANYGNITGNYRTQYYLTVSTDPPGIATIPGEGWYNESAGVGLTAPAVPNYSFQYWTVNTVPQGAGVQSLTLVMNASYNAQARYSPIIAYQLTILTTPGGTTSPVPGVYNYSSGQTVQVTANPASGYVLDHWELDGTNISASNNPYTVTMNMNHVLKAFFAAQPQPPSVSINPMSSSISPGQSVSFTSTVTGGTVPYLYQWYLNGAPVSGATSSTWTFTATTNGIYFVYVKVTDANGKIATSGTAEVIVVATAVGGYSVPIHKQTTNSYIPAYMFLLSLFSGALVAFKRKRK